MEESPPHSGQARVSIPYMSKDHTGPYLCNYRKSGVWSGQSDPLPLVVTGKRKRGIPWGPHPSPFPLTEAPNLPTGEYDAPRLFMNPGPLVPAGANVTFSCTATFKSGTFHLLQEGATGPPQKVESLVSSINGSTLFFIGPVSASHRGTYRCFRSPSSLPYQWSHPSQGLSLEVTGEHFLLSCELCPKRGAQFILVLATLAQSGRIRKSEREQREWRERKEKEGERKERKEKDRQRKIGERDR